MTRTTPPTAVRRRAVSPVSATSRIIAVSATIALLLAACGDDPGATGSDTTDRSTVAAQGTDAPTTDTGSGSPSVVRVPGPVAEAGGDAAPTADPNPGASTRLAYIEYVLGTELPALDSDAAAWVMRSGELDEARMAEIAAVLGVQGTVVHQPEDMGGGWTVGAIDGSGPSLWAYDDAVQSWWYSSGAGAGVTGCAVAEPAPEPEPDTTGDSPSDATSDATGDPVVVPDCPVPDPPSGVPTADEARTLATALLGELGVDPATVVLDVYADDWNANVTATVLLEGTRAPLTWSFSFGGDGELLYAGGLLGTPERVQDYPRIGAQAGFERLQANDFWWYGPMMDVARGGAESSDPAAAEEPAQAAEPAPPVGPTGDEPVSSDDGAGTPGAPGMPEPGTPIVVTITGVEEELWMVTDVDGTVWLLPGYAFIGDDDGRYSVPAVPDDLLQIVTPSPVEPLPVQDDVPVTDVSLPPSPTDTAVIPTTSTPDLADALGGLDSLIGLSEDEATKVVEQAGGTTRVVSIDGEDLAITMDLREDRVNLTLVDGLVTVATIG